METDRVWPDSGTMWTASAHIITAVIGSGVLSLAWAIGQLGWVAGPTVMLLFSFVTYYTSSLLADCYRSGDEFTGKRNYTYMDAVNANLSRLSSLPQKCILFVAVSGCRADSVFPCRWHQGPDMRVPAVCQHRRRCHRLHHCRLHQHAVSIRTRASLLFALWQQAVLVVSLTKCLLGCAGRSGGPTASTRRGTGTRATSQASRT